MKNVNLIFATVLFAIFALTSCQKEGLQEMESITENATTGQTLDIESILSQSELVIDNAFEIAPEKTDKNTANNRANSQLIFDAIHTVPANGLQLYYYAKYNLPDPMRHKIEVKVTPINGDQNLYISGRNAQNGTWRLMRQSANLGPAEEFSSFRKSDMMNYEDNLYISVTGPAQSSFRIQFYLADVDCMEYPPAQSIVTYEYTPVLACDGTPFPNPSSAKAAGYTSWTTRCGKADDGFYRNVSLFIPGTDLLIKRLRIMDGFRNIQIQTTSCLNPSNADCFWVQRSITRNTDGAWTATFNRNRPNGTKQLEIKMTFCAEGDMIHARLESTELTVSGGTMASSLRVFNESFEKI